jgi:hypothetical protein
MEVRGAHSPKTAASGAASVEAACGPAPDLCAAHTLLWNLFISRATLTNKFFVTTIARMATAN